MHKCYTQGDLVHKENWTGLYIVNLISDAQHKFGSRR